MALSATNVFPSAMQLQLEYKELSIFGDADILIFPLCVTVPWAWISFYTVK